MSTCHILPIRGSSVKRFFPLASAAAAATLLGAALAVALPSAASAETTSSLWSSSTVPAVVADPEVTSVELGVKFRSDVAGQVLGVRYYRSATNTGAHTGSLWSTSGALLATATFAAESSAGWQTVRFSSPVSVQAGQTYVASYHTDAGHYAADTATSRVLATAGSCMHRLLRACTTTDPAVSHVDLPGDQLLRRRAVLVVSCDAAARLRRRLRHRLPPRRRRLCRRVATSARAARPPLHNRP